MVCNSLVAFSCTALTIANNVEDFSVLKPLLVAYARVLKYRSTRIALRVFSSASNSLNNAAMSLRMAKEGRCEDRLEVREKEGTVASRVESGSVLFGHPRVDRDVLQLNLPYRRRHLASAFNSKLR
jgi:hypothetical protein